jgi:hypothetical protein
MNGYYSDLAATYAALILADEELEITVSNFDSGIRKGRQATSAAVA